MPENNEINKYESELKSVTDEIEDEIENLKYLLDFIPIENINFLSIHFKFNELLNKKDYLEKIIFNMKY